jgi:hypothetical protein
MVDMVIQSVDPNLLLSVDEETNTYEVKACRKIREGEELFLRYQDEEKPGDDDTALWSTAVQRGIPAINLSKPNPK